VIIHIHVEMSQRNSLYSYLKQTKLQLIFTKSENRRAEQFLPGDLVTVGVGGCEERV
jgi:hypothetical protein